METSKLTLLKDASDVIADPDKVQQTFSKCLTSFVESTKGITPSQAVVASSLILGTTYVAVKATSVAKKVMFNAIGKGQGVKWELGPFKLTTTTPNTAA